VLHAAPLSGSFSTSDVGAAPRRHPRRPDLRPPSGPRAEM